MVGVEVRIDDDLQVSGVPADLRQRGQQPGSPPSYPARARVNESSELVPSIANRRCRGGLGDREVELLVDPLVPLVDQGDASLEAELNQLCRLRQRIDESRECPGCGWKCRDHLARLFERPRNALLVGFRLLRLVDRLANVESGVECRSGLDHLRWPRRSSRSAWPEKLVSVDCSRPLLRAERPHPTVELLTAVLTAGPIRSHPVLNSLHHVDMRVA